MVTAFSAASLYARASSWPSCLRSAPAAHLAASSPVARCQRGMASKVSSITEGLALHPGAAPLGVFGHLGGWSWHRSYRQRCLLHYGDLDGSRAKVGQRRIAVGGPHSHTLGITVAIR